MNKLMETIEQAKQDAIASGSFRLPSKGRLLAQAGCSSGYFHQASDPARAALKAYEMAESNLAIRKYTPAVFAKLEAYEETVTALQQMRRLAADLKAENDRLTLELQLFRQFEAEWFKMRREVDRFTQQQHAEKEAA